MPLPDVPHLFRPTGPPSGALLSGGPLVPSQSVIFDTTWILFLLGLPGAPSSPSCLRAGVQGAHVQHQHLGREGVGDPD